MKCAKLHEMRNAASYTIKYTMQINLFKMRNEHKSLVCHISVLTDSPRRAFSVNYSP
jgi:hypothetical protein